MPEQNNENQNDYFYDNSWYLPSGKTTGCSLKKVILVVLLFSILTAIASIGCSYLIIKRSNVTNVSNMYEGDKSRRISMHTVDTAAQLTPAQIYETYASSTVVITVAADENHRGITSAYQSYGSGFVLTQDGYILTNYHVIENANQIQIRTFEGSTYPASVIGYDEAFDIAVLKAEVNNLTPIIWGDSGSITVGEPVVAIGNPLGELTFTLTCGNISALNRNISTPSGGLMQLLQTDCAINSGNSGGPLFNLNGEVIGITNAKFSSTAGEASIDNIGFAIPVNSVKEMVISIIENGYHVKPYIGISVTDVSSEMQSYGLPQGAAVRNVEKDSPAERAGLQTNDIITAINGSDLHTSADLIAIVTKASPSDVLELSVYRAGTLTELKITVGQRIISGLSVK